MEKELKVLASELDGELYWNQTMRTLYATDASAYRELPLAVAIPRNNEDIKRLIDFVNKANISLIPRAAGTSLAGQVVGNGLVVDISKHFNKVLEVNGDESWVRLQPGIIRDELNRQMEPYDLYFAPETSTANRAMIGGMVGNNSCGSNSIVYGTTREHLLSVKAFLSDGSEVEFNAMDVHQFKEKCAWEKDEGTLTLENKIYRNINSILSDPENQKEIRAKFPKRSIHRRNTGYAIDLLLESQPFTDSQIPFNFCRLIAGSEGTLAFVTEVKLNLVPLPPENTSLVCAHFKSVQEALKATVIAMQLNPRACELMDHYVLECTKENIEQQKNRFFIKGDPRALLVIELEGRDLAELNKKAAGLEKRLRTAGLGYHFPIVFGEDKKRVWDLRKAGLGLLANIPGDAKPQPVIEDTAVDVRELPDFIDEFNQILQNYGLHCVHYAHAGAGEIHLRPLLNLKTTEGNKLFRSIADEIARLVKKYRGSLSGEHGDGRLRGEFIPFMIGDKNFKLIKSIKETWDPRGIFNPGKIVDTPAMNESLRYRPGQETPEFDTILSFERHKGILRSAEQCNGSGDCRKTHFTGTTMCPSYMVTKNEKDTTRARANILREALTNNDKSNPFDDDRVLDVMDLCLSCKGCKSECPSNVDIAKLKSEFLQHYYDAHGVPFRSRIIGNFAKMNELAAGVPGFFNFLIKNNFTSSLGKRIIGFAVDRSLPPVATITLRNWFLRNKGSLLKEYQPFKRKVNLFCDEFTNYNDAEVGIKTVKLLFRLGYEVDIPAHAESARSYLSKGLLREAKKLAEENVELLKGAVTKAAPLIGIEPSAILSFRDEYPDLVAEKLRAPANDIAEHTFLLEEFLASEMDRGKIDSKCFTTEVRKMKLHGHCHQKALSSLTPSKKILSLPKNFEVQIIPSGCCGMAGSFGYEKEHYELSMQIAELVLFPAVRESSSDTLIVAAGTSCRHQIKDGTGKIAYHPAEVLYDALEEG